MPLNSDRERPLVSVFTAAHDIGAWIETPYRSLLDQTYEHWEWVVVDDSTGPETSERIAALAASVAAAGRVQLHHRQAHQASIGATKAMAARRCGGAFLVELDHDDELLPEALELIAATFLAHADVDFVYSDWIDWLDGREGGGSAATYPTGWGSGFGAYASETVGGRRIPVALAPPINWETLRDIVGMPNHVRAWRAGFYRRIGGHDPRLSVADDYELLVRTFLAGTMARIPRPLYFQHHGSRERTASRRMNTEIRRHVEEIAARHRKVLDRRCLLLGVTPSVGWALTGWEPSPTASAQLDVIAEAATDLATPLVSVVLPTYRRPELLRRALESVLGQTYPNFEVLVVGDACPDVDDVIAVSDDPRVRHSNLDRHHGDSGAAPRNHALRSMARGTLVAYLDDDNRWKPNHLESLVELLLEQSTAAYAFSSFEMDGETIVCRRPRRFQIDTSALLHRRFLLERFGYWRPASETDWAHDWELVSRWEGEPWAASCEPTVVYSLDTSTQGAKAIPAIKAAAHNADGADG